MNKRVSQLLKQLNIGLSTLNEELECLNYTSLELNSKLSEQDYLFLVEHFNLPAMQNLFMAKLEVQKYRNQLNKHFLQDNKSIDQLGEIEKFQYFNWIIEYGKKLTSFAIKFPFVCSSSKYSENTFKELYEWYLSWQAKDEKEKESIENEARCLFGKTIEEELTKKKTEGNTKGSIFSKLSIDRRKWSEKSRRAFTQEEINDVNYATIVEGNFGNNACFFMKAGGCHYIPLDQNSTLGIGENIDLNKAELVIYCKQGEADIMRVYI